MIESNRKNSLIETSEYPIYMGDSSYAELEKLLDRNKYSSVFILVDSNTKIDCLPLLTSYLDDNHSFPTIAIEQGEQNKNLKSLEYILVELSDLGADRKSLLINLGGGVVTDIGGFASSIYKRGIDFVNIPTTLLSMVDASIGGKTGIDLHALKNQIGTFSFPEMVIIDTRYLATLAEREFTSGFAEMLKHGLIAEKELWVKLKDIHPTQEKAKVLALIESSILVKKAVVEEDPTEKGLRKILNFGHTLGHAVESFYLNTEKPYLHGEAIAIGMICEAFLAKEKGFISESDLVSITTTMHNIFDINPILKTNYDGILDYLKHDKKNKGKAIQYSLLKTIGKANFDVVCDIDEAKQALDFYNNSHKI